MINEVKKTDWPDGSVSVTLALDSEEEYQALKLLFEKIDDELNKGLKDGEK